MQQTVDRLVHAGVSWTWFYCAAPRWCQGIIFHYVVFIYLIP
jgi:hypothetical protein